MVILLVLVLLSSYSWSHYSLQVVYGVVTRGWRYRGSEVVAVGGPGDAVVGADRGHGGGVCQYNNTELRKSSFSYFQF